MSELAGKYYYFKDFVIPNSVDYGKIAIIKAENIKEAWTELHKRHIKQYGQPSSSIMTMYEYLEMRNIE